MFVVFGAKKKPPISGLNGHLSTEAFVVVERSIELATHPFLMFDEAIGRKTGR